MVVFVVVGVTFNPTTYSLLPALPHHPTPLPPPTTTLSIRPVFLPLPLHYHPHPRRLTPTPRPPLAFRHYSPNPAFSPSHPYP